jgi:predicted DNA-binding mobile mystery protein A
VSVTPKGVCRCPGLDQSGAQCTRESGADLAARLQVTPASVSDIERSESQSRIRLDTLARAAEAMGCDLVYALIPRDGLVEIVQRQAREKVEEQTRAVSRGMDLEAQSTHVDDEVVREEMERLTAEDMDGARHAGGPMTGNPGGPMKVAKHGQSRSHARGERHIVAPSARPVAHIFRTRCPRPVREGL